MSKTIYSFPDFKEPEKTTAWKDRDAANDNAAPAWLRDTSLEAAKQRTEAIKAKMSPEGALRLPPLLEKQRLEYGIPDSAFRVQATFDRIIVFPIDAYDGEEAEKTAGGIVKPDAVKLRDTQEGHRAVLLSAGLTAMDHLASHGIEPGHVVWSNRNAPFARRIETICNKPMFVLVMRDGDLAGSETLATELREGKRKIVDIGGDGQFEHQLASDRDGAWDVSKKRSAYVNDTW